MKKFFLALSVIFALLLMTLPIMAEPLYISKSGLVWVNPVGGVEVKSDKLFTFDGNYFGVVGVEPLAYRLPVKDAPMPYLQTCLLVTMGVIRLEKVPPHVGLSEHFGDLINVGMTTDFKGNAYYFLDSSGAANWVLKFLKGEIQKL